MLLPELTKDEVIEALDSIAVDKAVSFDLYSDVLVKMYRREKDKNKKEVFVTLFGVF